MHKKEKPNRYKLTPQMDKALKILAESLGKFQRVDKQGNLLFRVEQKFLGIFTVGNKREKRWENKKVPIYVNHYINLVQIYQKEGDQGVSFYMKFFTDLREKQQAEEKAKAPLSIVKEDGEKETVVAD